MNTDVLREAFREDALLAGPPPADPYESVLARRQQSNRRRLTSLAAGVTVAMVAVAIPIGISLVGPLDTNVAAPPTIPAADVFAGPARGSLAGDAEFVEGVRQLSWKLPDMQVDPLMPDAPIETRSVVFAGDVAGGRWALVVGANSARLTENDTDVYAQTDLGALSETAAVWYVGPRGAAPEEMQLATLPRGVAVELPMSLYDGATGALVVVAARGDFVEVSARPEVAADAAVTRTYTDTETTDGVAVLALESNLYATVGMPAAQYRVTRAGVVVAEQIPEVSGAVKGWAEPPLPLHYLRSQGERVDGLGNSAELMAWQILSEYGLAPDEIQLDVHYVGSLPGSGGDTAELTVLTVTFPSGAVLIRGDWMQPLVEPQGPYDAGSFGGGPCVDEISAAGVAAAERTLAMRCDVLSGNEDPATESTLVVLAPVGGTATYAVTAGGTEPITVDFDGTGVGLVAFPAGADTVVLHAADGTILDEVPILAP